MKLLLFVSKSYSFSILKPVQNAAEQSGHTVKWFTANSAKVISPTKELLSSSDDVTKYKPDAVIVPGNVVPDFWPGLKVQIFHGLGEEKKGHYRITGFFDLYCTPGPHMTEKFQTLSEKHGHFLVKETGWPKLDMLKTSTQNQRKLSFGLQQDDPIILYAPTFSPRYTSAPALLSTITRLCNVKPFHWFVKFHPLMDINTISKYKSIQKDNLRIIDDPDVIPAMEASDILITDTSSVAHEYLFLDRPIITYKATTRKNKGINLTNPEDLESAIEVSLASPKQFSSNRLSYLNQLHPYTDGKSSERIIKTIQAVLDSEEHLNLKSKPKNWIKKYQIRRYFR